MQSSTADKVNRLCRHLENIILELNTTNSIFIHYHISQFFYMQNLEELKLLNLQIKEAEKRLEIVQRRATNHYKEIYCQWRKDVRLIKRNMSSAKEELKNEI